MKKESVEPFRKMLNERCNLTKDDLTEKVLIDMIMPLQCVTESFVAELENLEPFGKGNTKPVFALRNVQLVTAKILGRNKNVLKFSVRDKNGTYMEALYFGDIQDFLDNIDEKYGVGTSRRLQTGRCEGITMSLTYYPGMNEYMGKVTPQIVITHYQ